MKMIRLIFLWVKKLFLREKKSVSGTIQIINSTINIEIHNKD